MAPLQLPFPGCIWAFSFLAGPSLVHLAKAQGGLELLGPLEIRPGETPSGLVCISVSSAHPSSQKGFSSFLLEKKSGKLPSCQALSFF